ncbi:MAG TPA: ACT domain-containing protein, partial [Polyangiaceae bacterium]
VMVSLEDAARTGDGQYKTSVAFSVPDGRGQLLRVLTIFDEEGINLTRIESRPNRETRRGRGPADTTKTWDYIFLADLEGHREDANVARAMERLRERCPFVKHLGSYPRARRA